MGQKWPNCDLLVLDFLNEVIQTLKEEVQSNLYSVVLHGSLAMGSFYPPKSDIDLIIVVSDHLEVEKKKRLLDLLAKIHMNRPIIGGLELSILTKEIVQNPTFPLPYELHFSHNYAYDIINKNYDQKTLQGNDVDLSAHLVVSKYRGVSLYGHAPNSYIGNVPWSDYLSSVLDDLDWILADEHIFETPFYSILNSCRVLQMIEEGEGTVLSKEEGAVWALNNLPNKFHPVVLKALDCYRSSSIVTENERRLGGIVWDNQELLLFRDYVRVCRKKFSPELMFNSQKSELE